MRAGKLRTKIKLLRHVKEQDRAGGVIDNWVAYATVMSEDKVVSTRSLISGGVDINEEIHTIMIRYRADIKPSDRIELPDGRVLSINGYPKPLDQKKKALVLTGVYDGS